MHKITFTLAGIRKHNPCKDRYKKLVKALGGVKSYGKDTPINIDQLYATVGHDDTLWCLRTTSVAVSYLWRHFAVDAASQAEYSREDKRSLKVLNTARLHAQGKAKYSELAALATEDVAGIAWATSRPKDWYAASIVAWAAAHAAGMASRDAVRDAQMRLLSDYCRLGKRPAKSEERLARYIKEASNA